MRAPWSEQLKLLDLQDCDTKISRAQFQLKQLPEYAQQQEIEQKQAALGQKKIQVETLLSELNRKNRAVEQDLAQIRDRQVTQQQRLDSGQGSPKELLALQGELKQIRTRIQKLEEQQLQLLTESERLAAIADKIQQREAEYAAELSELNQRIQQQAGHLEQQIADFTRQGSDLRAGISEPLLELYEQVKTRTGGVGAIRIVEGYAPDYGLEFSAAEQARIRQADPDTILCSEEYDYILVRCQ